MNQYTSYSSLLDFTFNNPAEKRDWHKRAKGMKEPHIIIFVPDSYGYEGESIPIDIIDRADFAEPDGWFRCDAYSQAIFNIEDNFYRNVFLPAHSK